MRILNRSHYHEPVFASGAGPDSEVPPLLAVLDESGVLSFAGLGALDGELDGASLPPPVGVSFPPLDFFE